jgi:hypothetical protein
MTESKIELDEQRNITRMDYPRKGTHGQTRGWWVRVKRGKKPFSRLFSDNKYGGAEKALVAAKQYRDEIEAKHGLPEIGFTTAKTKKNRSGVAGVYKTVNTVHRKSGRSYSYLFWRAMWVDPKTGKRGSKSFSTPKYGEAEALRLALKAREEAIAAILGIKGSSSLWGQLSPNQLVEIVETVQTAYEKGQALEELIYRLFQTTSGFSVTDRRATTETEEIDLVVLNDSTDPRFSRESAIMLIECKNWSTKCGKNEFVLFKEKIENRSSRCTMGFLISWNGFAETVTKEMLRGSREQTLVIPIDGESIKRAVEEENF